MASGFHSKKTRLFALYFGIIFCVAAGPNVLLGGLPPQPNQYVYTTPERLDDGWETASLQETNVDLEKIDKLIHFITDLNAFEDGDVKPRIDGILLVKDGKVVLEEYFNNQNRDKLHDIKSVTKSIGSVLTGIAIDKGFIENVDEKIYPLLAENWPDTQWGEEEKRITLKHLLTMTSGYDCDDQLTEFNCQHRMSQTSDWVKFTLKLPVIHQPGVHWAYNSSTPMLIAAVIKEKSGMRIQAFAKSYLFQPLGIQDGVDFKWKVLASDDEKVDVFFAGGASMKPRVMAKFGYMVLNGGRWKGNQIVSQTWISESTGRHETTNRNFRYGYLWWRGEAVVTDQRINALWAAGHGGQRIFILPELNSVVVFISRLPNPTGIITHGLMTTYVIPAILPPAPSRQTIRLNADTAQKYLGEYIFNEKNEVLKQKLQIEKQGNRLWLKPSGWSKLELFPEKEHQFFGTSKEIGDVLVRFTLDDAGKVSFMTVDFAFTSWVCDKF